MKKASGEGKGIEEVKKKKSGKWSIPRSRISGGKTKPSVGRKKKQEAEEFGEADVAGTRVESRNFYQRLGKPAAQKRENQVATGGKKLLERGSDNL